MAQHQRREQTLKILNDLVTRTILPNGLTVLIREDHSAPVVAIVTYVKAGYFDETDDVSGIAHVLEHMFFKGTPTRGPGEIAKQTKAIGGYLNAHTIYDNTTYYTVVPSSEFRTGLAIQADAYANSVIDAGELARELEVIIQEAKRKSDNPAAVSVETLYELLHDTHRIRRWRIGREKELRAFSRDDLVQFYRNFYAPSNTILCIVGDVSGAGALDDVKARFGALPESTPERSHGPIEGPPAEFRYRELSGDVEQTQLVMGWRTVPALHADCAALDVLASILSTGRSSRLYRAVRERSLASSISAYNYSPGDIGVFAIHAEGQYATSRAALSAAGAQLREIREHGVDEPELHRVRGIFEARWARGLETMEGQANHLAEWEALGGWQLGEDYFRSFLAVSAADVHRVAREYIREDSGGVVTFRPAAEPSVASSANEMRQLLWTGSGEPLPEVTASRASSRSPITSANPTFELEESGVRLYRAPNGLAILVRQKPGSAISYIGYYEPGGATTDTPATEGLANLAARVMTKGTRTRTAAQLALDAELLGGSLGASTGRETSGWSISVPTPRTGEAIDLLADAVLNPTFPDEAFEIERSVVLSEIAQMRDDMYSYPIRLAAAAAYAGHGYGQAVLGTEATVRALTPSAARLWHERFVGSDRAVLGIVGALDADEIAARAAELFAGARTSRTNAGVEVRWPEEVRTRIEERDKAQTAMAIAFRGPGRRDPERFAAQLLATVASGLGGRFFEELRDRNSLAYTVHAFTSGHSLGGAFYAYIATSPEKEAAARDGLLAEFRKLVDSPISNEELLRAKTYSIGIHAIQQESGASLLGDMVDAYLLGSGLQELSSWDNEIRAVTAGQIQELARRNFQPGQRVEGVIRGVGRTV